MFCHMPGTLISEYPLVRHDGFHTPPAHGWLLPESHNIRSFCSGRSTLPSRLSSSARPSLCAAARKLVFLASRFFGFPSPPDRIGSPVRFWVATRVVSAFVFLFSSFPAGDEANFAGQVDKLQSVISESPGFPVDL